MASGGHSSSRCAGLSLSRPLSLRSTGSRRAGSAVVAHGPSRSAACGILPYRDTNPCPLHWQADSQPLRHQGSPGCVLLKSRFNFVVVFDHFPQFCDATLVSLSNSVTLPFTWKALLVGTVAGASHPCPASQQSKLRLGGLTKLTRK